MGSRKVWWWLARHQVWLVALVALAGAGCGGPFPQSTLAPKGDFAQMVDAVFRTTVAWAIVVFVLVEGALLFAIFRFRQRPGDGQPPQVHGHALLEVVWTLIPAAILTAIAVPTVRTIFATHDLPAEALEIEVIGRQWWWEFRYPEQRIVTANEMHVPVGRPVVLKIRTADVLHSFWVPQFAAKRDAFHNRYTTLYFTADSVGAFPGQCAEFCGIQHARMGSLVVVEPPQAFEEWVARQQVGSPLINGGAVAPDTVTPADPAEAAAKAARDSLLARGRQTFISAGCLGCHAMVGTPTAGLLDLIGPNLSHFGSRRRIAAGVLPNTDEHLARWLREPQRVKEGSLMKLPRDLTDEEIRILVAYLREHR
jgi:cytochrome c oxidase subunit 2